MFQNKLDEAEPHLSEALRLDPDLADAQLNLGILRAQQGRLDDAIAHFNEVLRIKPDDPLARNNLETALQQKSQRAPAEARPPSAR